MIAELSDDGTKVDGGVQAVTKYLIKELTRSDQLDLHLLTFSYGTTGVRTLDGDGYTRHIIPGARLGAFSLYAQDQRILNRRLNAIRPDIVHSQGAGHYGIVAIRSGYPAVITIHGIMAEEAKYAASLRLRFRRRLISALSDRLCIRRAEHTVLISPYVADYYGPRLTGHHYHIPNPVASSFFAIPRQEEPGKILFAGRLLPLKGVTDLLDAAAEMGTSSGIRMTLAGSLDNHSYVRKLKDQAARLQIEEAVEFAGILDEETLQRELGRSSVLVLPSYQETAPMVIQEAMASGLPVVATRVGGIPYQVMHGHTGYLVPPGDVTALSRCLREILTNAGRRHAFGLAARARARDEYSAEAVARQTVEVYKRILSR